MATQTPTKLAVDPDPNRAKLFAASPSPGKAQLKAQKLVESLTGGIQIEHDPQARDVVCNYLMECWLARRRLKSGSV
jgi:hypothetical protein